MEAAAAAVGEIGGDPIWSATTNWIPTAGGSISDAISYDTSDEIESEQTAKPLLLLRPEGDDPPPCEVTIYFRKMHEIHRVYLRSTARVYEIYYSPDDQDSSEEYLCTVRCSATASEMIPESVGIGATNGCWGNNNETAAGKDEVVRSDSNISDEDGWVQVKASDSSLQDDKEYSLSNKCDIGVDSPIMQIHYEATADISDYSPCVSLKLRLLSIQTKACVHIEEIYVYADPVEPSNSDPPVNMGESMGRSSLLAMLVPSLMQMSKSRVTQDKCFSDEARVSEYRHASAKATQTVSSDVRNAAAQEACSGKSHDQNLGIGQEQYAIEPEEVEPIQEVTASYKMPNTIADDNNRQAYSRIEKVLDELVLKVGRVEAFCLKFEENMLKPLSCMEQRLQQLELKVDALAMKNLSSEQCLCSSVSSLESNEYDIKNKDDNYDITESKEVTGFVATASPADEAETFDLESQTHSGLVIKAPEFLNEEDDCSYNEDRLNTLMEDLPKQKKPLTIDGALASSLAAFLTSTIVKPPSTIPSLTGVTQESVSFSNSCADSLPGVTSDGAGNSSDKPVIEDSILVAGREGTCFSDSSLSSCDDAIVNDELTSDMKNKSCADFDSVGEGATFDNSLLADDGNMSPAYTSHADSVFIVKAPEFLNSSGSFNGDDMLDSPDLDGLEHQTSIPPGSQRVPQPAEFPSSTILQSTEKISTLFGVPSGLSSIDYNLSALTVAVPSEGSDELGRENHEENVMNDDVWLEPIWSRSPLEVGSSEQEHHDGMGLKEWLSSKKDDELFARKLHDHTLSELNAAVSQNCHSGSNADDNDIKAAILCGFNQHGSCQSGSNVDDGDSKDAILQGFNQQHGVVDVSGRENHGENVMKERMDLILSRSPLEASSEQVLHDGLGFKEWLSGKNADGLLARNLHGHTFSELNAVGSQNCHVGNRADDNDAEAALLHGFDQHYRGFEVSSNTSSGLRENPIKQRAVTEWDAATSNYASEHTFEFEKTFGQAELTTNTRRSTAGCNQETPNKEPEDAICSVKFTPESNWIAGLPLELLLGEVPDAKLLEPSAGGGDGECGAAGRNSSSDEDIVWEADLVGSLLAEVPLCTPYEDAGS